ncbi:nitrile hydratase accessory protein [Breoghania sp. L-A4]|uniref:nitrile hydratase accessory protein n=1 Tax=Breoghania sp. L-A4 TaxID=2304600 RepID=UPI0019676E85|nr:nitrile hydratase accessory protein [Breoghania sp. L-A4]
MNVLDRTALEAIPSIPRDADGPVFAEPWQAKAFAMALRLHEQGVFTWSEWAETLSATIAHAQAGGDPDAGNTYYLHWLKALETIVTAKGVSDPATLEDRRNAWDRAAKATPHGQPIELGAEKRG